MIEPNEPSEMSSRSQELGRSASDLSVQRTAEIVARRSYGKLVAFLQSHVN